MKPRKVYLSQNKAPEIIPQIKASFFPGNPSETTMAFNTRYKTTVRRGKHSSSVFPPKLNILHVYTTPRNSGIKTIENFEGTV